MKPFYLMAIGLSVAVFSSCNNDKKEADKASNKDTIAIATTPVATVAAAAAKEGKSTEIEASAVPEPIRTSFAKKYPKAQKVEWVKYEPIEYDDLKMDDQYYYVRYNDGSKDAISWYNNRGEWVKTSTRVAGNSNLPEAVNATIAKEFPGYTIEEMDKENDKDRDLYEIELKKGDEKAKIKILPNGTIVKRK